MSCFAEVWITKGLSGLQGSVSVVPIISQMSLINIDTYKLPRLCSMVQTVN